MFNHNKNTAFSSTSFSKAFIPGRDKQKSSSINTEYINMIQQLYIFVKVWYHYCSILTVLPESFDEWVVWVFKQLHDVLVQRIAVLLQPLSGVVDDNSCVMFNCECVLVRTRRLLEDLRLFVIGYQLLHETLVSRIRHQTIFVQQCENSHGLNKKIDDQINISYDIKCQFKSGIDRTHVNAKN